MQVGEPRAAADYLHTLPPEVLYIQREALFCQGEESPRSFVRQAD